MIDASKEISLLDTFSLEKVNKFYQQDLDIALNNYQNANSLSATHHAILFGLVSKSGMQIDINMIIFGESVR